MNEQHGSMLYARTSTMALSLDRWLVGKREVGFGPPIRFAKHLVYGFGFLCLDAWSLHDVVPTLCGRGN